MIQNQRIFFSDNGVENDFSIALNDFRSSSEVIPYVSGEDYIYIASDLPFNHRYFFVDSINALASNITIDIWYNDTWNTALDVIDSTSIADASMAQSGLVRWTTDREKSWSKETDSEDVDGIDIEGLYNMYWLRVGFDSDLDALTSLTFIGNKFSEDSVLETYYPDLANASLKTAFESGKTDWNDQHFMAAEIITRDLKKRNVIKSGSQILDFEKFQEPSVHKVAELVYWGLGRSYEDNRKMARQYYNEAIDVHFFNVDLDKNARLSDGEKIMQTGYVTR